MLNQSLTLGYISLKALHLFGAILWFGGIITVAFAAVAFAKASEAGAIATLRNSARLAPTLGLIANWLGGLSIFILNIDVWRSQGWVHAKILLVFIAAGLTGALTADLKKIDEGKREANPTKLQIFGGALVLLLILTLYLAAFKPFVRG